MRCSHHAASAAGGLGIAGLPIVQPRRRQLPRRPIDLAVRYLDDRKLHV